MKNDLLDVIGKRDKNKVSEDSCVDDGQDSDGKCNSDDCNTKEITKEDIEEFFIFDQVIDAVNAFKEIKNRIISDNWTKEDEDLMRQYYPSIGTKIKPMLSVKRSNVAIRMKAFMLGLTYDDNKWSKDDENLIWKYYPSMGRKVKSMLSVERSEGAIYIKAKAMGLTPKRNRWQEKDKVFLEENYGILSTKEIAEKLNRSEKSINQMARKLNLNIYCNWSNEEFAILKKFFPLEGAKVANRLPYKTEKQCQSKAFELKIKYIGNKTSKYKYVSWQNQKWRVRFKINGKHKDFGSFKDEDEAGRVAMQKAKEYGKKI